MMKQLICIGAALMMGVVSLSAQPAEPAPSHAGSVFVSLQGGTVLNIYENAFSYRDHHRSLELITLDGVLSVGYDFNDAYGARLSVGYGNDAGAANVRQTSATGFWPYRFHHLSGFADFLINLNGLSGRSTAFRSKLYAGVGAAYTFGFKFTDAEHAWQKPSEKNVVPGFRGGFIAEYDFPSGFGIFADLCGEAFHDRYNGLMPTEQDMERYEGYPGFPLDLRGKFSLGVIYHF
jgi:hypothetical protein